MGRPMCVARLGLASGPALGPRAPAWLLGAAGQASPVSELHGAGRSLSRRPHAPLQTPHQAGEKLLPPPQCGRVPRLAWEPARGLPSALPFPSGHPPTPLWPLGLFLQDSGTLRLLGLRSHPDRGTEQPGLLLGRPCITRRAFQEPQTLPDPPTSLPGPCLCVRLLSWVP